MEMQRVTMLEIGEVDNSRIMIQGMRDKSKTDDTACPDALSNPDNVLGVLRTGEFHEFATVNDKRCREEKEGGDGAKISCCTPKVVQLSASIKDIF